MYGLGQTMVSCPGGPGCPGSSDQPDQLTPSGLLALQGGESAPNLNPGIDLSSGTVASEVAGGVPVNTQVAGVLGTSGSTANWILIGGAAVIFVVLIIGASKAARRK
jgi:hypothetical protein